MIVALEWAVIALVLAVNGAFILMTLGALLGAAWGAPFVPTGAKTAKKMLRAAGEHIQGATVCDLGAGDARLLVAARRAGARRCFGIEISVVVWMLGQLRIALCGERKQVALHRGNMFAPGFVKKAQQADVVLCYLLPKMMQRVWRDIVPNLRPGTIIISHGFSPPGIEPKSVIPRDSKGGRVLVFVL